MKFKKIGIILLAFTLFNANANNVFADVSEETVKIDTISSVLTDKEVDDIVSFLKSNNIDLNNTQIEAIKNNDVLVMSYDQLNFLNKNIQDRLLKKKIKLKYLVSSERNKHGVYISTLYSKDSSGKVLFEYITSTYKSGEVTYKLTGEAKAVSEFFKDRFKDFLNSSDLKYTKDDLRLWEICNATYESTSDLAKRLLKPEHDRLLKIKEMIAMAKDTNEPSTSSKDESFEKASKYMSIPIKNYYGRANTDNIYSLKELRGDLDKKIDESKDFSFEVLDYCSGYIKSLKDLKSNVDNKISKLEVEQNEAKANLKRLEDEKKMETKKGFNFFTAVIWFVLLLLILALFKMLYDKIV